MQVLIFSDIHIHKHKQSQDRLEDCVKVLEWVCDTAHARKISDVLFCGDLFQDRQKIDVYTYQRTFEVFNKNADLRFHLLLGNHDLWFAEKWEVSSVLPFKAFEQVRVINTPTSTVIGGRTFDWLPFVKNPVKVVDTHFPERKDHVLLAHLAVDGCQLNSSGHVSDVSVEHEADMVKVKPDIFHGWDKVFLGHYHKAQKISPTVEYVGSPLQLNFSEAYQSKHIIVLDVDTLETEYVVNSFSPQHLVVKENELATVDLTHNYVSVIGDVETFDTFEIKKKVEGNQARGLSFREEKGLVKKTDSQEDKIKFDTTGGKLLERFIEAVGCGTLDKAKLIQLGTSICESQT